MKSEGKDYLASMGIYIFNRELLVELMANLILRFWEREIIPQAVGNKRY
jgi:glucose-1-phosphate adenylyltransferase